MVGRVIRRNSRAGACKSRVGEHVSAHLAEIAVIQLELQPSQREVDFPYLSVDGIGDFSPQFEMSVLPTTGSHELGSPTLSAGVLNIQRVLGSISSTTIDTATGSIRN